MKLQKSKIGGVRLPDFEIYFKVPQDMFGVNLRINMQVNKKELTDHKGAHGAREIGQWEGCLPLHTTNPGSNLASHMVGQAPPGVIPVCRARNKPCALLGVV